MSDLVIGVIEWSSESGQAPTVIAGETAELVRRRAVKVLAPMVESGDFDQLEDGWLEQNPAPDLGDAAAVAAWLQELWECTTEAWIGLYGAPGTPLSKECDSFIDAREMS